MFLMFCIKWHFQIHNNDGVWIRLSQDSIHQCCSSTCNGYTEAWALQYNQHLGKTLLVPVDEPKSILDEIIKNAIRKQLHLERKTRKGLSLCPQLSLCYCFGFVRIVLLFTFSRVVQCRDH